MKIVWHIIYETVQQWFNDRTQQLAAALAFYAMFSIAPLLIITIALAGFFFGEDAARGEIVYQLDDHIGQEGAEAVQALVEGARSSPSGTFATITSLVFLGLASIRVFIQLQQILNQIWHVEPKPGTWLDWNIVRKRLISFAMVISLGALLMVAIIINSVLPVAYNFLEDVLPRVQLISQIVSTIVTIALLTLFFALIYKVLPDVQIEWRDVWLGAFLTSLLIIIGNIFIALYLRYSGTVSAFGAAGSFIALMLWIYYSSMIAFFGAEFTQVYAHSRGRQIQPDRNMVSTERQPPEQFLSTEAS